MDVFPKVCDLSHHNTPTSFEKAYDFGIRGIIHKSSQGTGMQDKKYAERRKLASAAGMLWGAYHFATNADPKAQVDHFIKSAEPDDNTLMALDFEPNGANTMSLAQAKVFLDYGAEKLGRPMIIYSGNLVKEKLLKLDGFFDKHKLWLAEYNKSYRLPKAWGDDWPVWLWQYTGDGIGNKPTDIPGLGKGIDVNSYEGTDEQLAKEWNT